MLAAIQKLLDKVNEAIDKEDAKDEPNTDRLSALEELRDALETASSDLEPL